MAPELISRASAKANGLARYFTGKPCKHGHISERVVANGACVVCCSDIEKRYRANNPERYRENRIAIEAKYRRGHRDGLRAKYRRSWQNASEDRKERHRIADKKWRDANPEKVRENIDRWEAANPERKRQHGKKWRRANPDKVRKKNRNYKTANAERLAPINRARVDRWRVDNPELARANARKSRHTRRARQYAAGGSYTKTQIQELLEKQGWKCVYCPADLRGRRELDHIVALARGGPNDISNLQWLCRPCNRKKRDRDHLEFAQEMAKLQQEVT